MLSLVMTYSLLYKVAPLLPPPLPTFFSFPMRVAHEQCPHF